MDYPEMPPWMELVVVVICVFILAGILGLFVWRFFNSKSRSKLDHIDLTGRVRVGHQQTLQDGITKLHQESRKQRPLILSTRRRTASPIFSWGEHPSLVTDAVENGWSCFAFVAHTELPPSPPSRSTFLGLCGAADIGQDPEPDISWEVCQGSADLVQKIRLNHHHGQPPLSSLSVIKTSLPLPGPPLGNSSFPQEAFFEITILSFGNRHGSEIKEGEKTKLTQDMSNLRSKSESLVYTRRAEELTLNVRDDGKSQAEAAAAFGLTFGGSPPLKLPGSYLGSIGFNSTGSVYLDGVKLVFESQKAEWAMWGNNVIGCGFDPKQKMVFFTMGSDLLHVIYCKSEVFGAPMYPIIAAHSDMVVLVNFGQFPFEYAPANDNRTSNPCFTGPAVRPSVSALGYEDSKELFSMGRIDAQWLNGSMYRGSHNNNNNSSVDIDVESEADLFEIVLDSSSGISQFPGNVMTGNNNNNKNIKINSSSR